MTNKNKPNKDDLKIAREFKRELNSKLGNKLLKAVLYGSRARGNAKKYSDMDIFLLMSKRPNYGSKESHIIDKLAYSFLDRYNTVVSPVPYSINDYKKWHDLSPILYWIDREGINL